jgi:hypothetical protein
MVTRFVAANTQSALEVLATERERTTDEQEAFAQFHDRIAAMEISEGHPDREYAQSAGVQPTLQTQSDTQNQLQDIRESYRGTVMSLPHYDDEYSDTLAESLAEEFCPEIATALTTGSQVTPPLRTYLITESQQAQTERADFLQILSRETESLRSADERIATIGSDLDTLAADSLETWTPAELAESRDQLCAAEDRCEELATARQSTVQTTRIPGPIPHDIDLNEYLYQSLAVTYPILADLAEMAETLHTERSRVNCALELAENKPSSPHLLSP